MFSKAFIISLAICGIFAFSNANSVSADAKGCPQICQTDYAPVCATNGKIYKEFGNKCELSASNCRLQRSAQRTYVAADMEWCTSELVASLDGLRKKLNNLDLETAECLAACPLIYRPVCVSNGKYRVVLSNDCIMGSLNCALAGRGAKSFRILKYDDDSC